MKITEAKYTNRDNKGRFVEKLTLDQKKRLSEKRERRLSVRDSEYVMLHKWLRDNYGNASYCAKDHSHIKKQYQWANISGQYKWDISDFIPLCTSCHRKMDFTEPLRKKYRDVKLGNKYKAKSVKQYSKEGEFIQEFESSTEVFRQLKISQSAIANCLAGKSETAGGYVWKR